ncbi:sensor histidine kinase [Rhizobiaceae bacterium BDR2-2]|uniref:histidine kinase n=1 Tax=Ectorhizobium quercum TaxID=2965071 RepID=A0AAE3SUB8_9HYPH|nr:sensor histidine kinase [Ectorhizobium quercum]MCX8996907.1 sensor histidine kinase [Ectorhizobium quercum]
MREFLIPGLIDLKLCFIVQGPAGDINYVANVPAPWQLDMSRECEPDMNGIFGTEIADRLARAKDRLVAAGDRTVVEIMAGAEQIFEFRLQAVAIGEGGLHYLTTIVDRSEERHRERILKALLREVSHRSKNLLAIIQSLALQTARHSRSLDLFLQKFRGRLYSLSQSQDLITDSSWRGAGLFSLIRQQTEKYLPENSELVRIEGEDMLLTPNAALHIGLALHELVINAVIHGGLLVNGKPVVITCRRHEDGDTTTIEVIWKEMLSASARQALQERENHFGSTVLERVVPASVNGTAEYVIGDDCIRYAVSFPLDPAE